MYLESIFYFTSLRLLIFTSTIYFFLDFHLLEFWETLKIPKKMPKSEKSPNSVNPKKKKSHRMFFVLFPNNACATILLHQHAAYPNLK